MTQLVLSVFPGVDLLGMAFEQEGFCVVRGPDLLWGGDVRRFHPPAGRFDGVIGGPPCQGHSTYAGINRAAGNNIVEDMTPEFSRCCKEAAPSWFLMENVVKVPNLVVEGYTVQRLTLNNRYFGERQSRRRVFQFGSKHGIKIHPEFAVFDHLEWQGAVLASEGASGRILNRRLNGKCHSVYSPRRPYPLFCELQGLPKDFLSDSPFQIKHRYKLVGNGVPLPMGRAIAKAIKQCLSQPTVKT